MANGTAYPGTPTAAIKYLIRALEEQKVDGVKFNNYYFVPLEELWAIHTSLLYKYYEDRTTNCIEETDSKEIRRTIHAKAFAMLPSFYILSFSDDNTYAVEKRVINCEEANTIFVFSSLEKANNYINKNMLYKDGIVATHIKNFDSIEEICKNIYNYLVIDGEYVTNIEELIKIEEGITN